MSAKARMTVAVYHIDGLVQYCSIPIANALQILQSCTKRIGKKMKTRNENAIRY